MLPAATAAVTITLCVGKNKGAGVENQIDRPTIWRIIVENKTNIRFAIVNKRVKGLNPETRAVFPVFAVQIFGL